MVTSPRRRLPVDNDQWNDRGTSLTCWKNVDRTSGQHILLTGVSFLDTLFTAPLAKNSKYLRDAFRPTAFVVSPRIDFTDALLELPPRFSYSLPASWIHSTRLRSADQSSMMTVIWIRNSKLSFSTAS
jgi:hypothetical protein